MNSELYPCGVCPKHFTAWYDASMHCLKVVTVKYKRALEGKKVDGRYVPHGWALDVPKFEVEAECQTT